MGVYLPVQADVGRGRERRVARREARRPVSTGARAGYLRDLIYAGQQLAPHVTTQKKRECGAVESVSADATGHVNSNDVAAAHEPNSPTIPDDAAVSDGRQVRMPDQSSQTWMRVK